MRFGHLQHPSAALLACINDELGQDPDDDVTETQAAGIENLDCQNEGVRDLTGMEHLTSLQELHLGGNEIINIASLAGLSELNLLSLPENQIVDLEPLGGLDNLRFLSLYNNQIEHVSPLADLTGLLTLSLYNNKIIDVSPLGGLTNLRSLVLNNNQIVDVRPLDGLTNLNSLRLLGNQIVDVSPLEAISQTASTFLVSSQAVDLDDVTAGEAQDNPVVGLDGQPVPLDALYDADTNTFTPDAEGTGSVGWDDGDAFSGILEFTAVEPVVVVDLQVTASATEVDEGDSVDLTVTGIDEAGAEVGVDEADLVVTSDVDTDVIDGLTVTFPSASERVLTVTHEPSGATGSVTVTVVAAEEEVKDPGENGEPGDPSDPADPADPAEDDDPAAAPEDQLPATGTEFAMINALVALLLAAGALLLNSRRRAVERI